MIASQARAPSGSIVISIWVGSIDWILHPSVKLDWISALLTRRGPQSPGCRSLKQSMK